MVMKCFCNILSVLLQRKKQKTQLQMDEARGVEQMRNYNQQVDIIMDRQRADRIVIFYNWLRAIIIVLFLALVIIGLR